MRLVEAQLGRVREAIGGAIRGFLEPFPSDTIPVLPAEGEKRAKLEKECRRLIQKPIFLASDFNEFVENMIGLLGGEEQDLNPYVGVKNKKSHPLFLQGENSAVIYFDWEFRERREWETTEETYGWINVNHNLVILSAGDEEALKQQEKPLVSETFTYQEGVAPIIDIWENRGRKSGLDPLFARSFLSGDVIELTSFGVFPLTGSHITYTPSDAAMFCTKVFSLYEQAQ